MQLFESHKNINTPLEERCRYLVLTKQHDLVHKLRPASLLFLIYNLEPPFWLRSLRRGFDYVCN